MTIQTSEFQNKFPLNAKRKFWKKIIDSLPLAFVFSLFFGPLFGIGMGILIFGTHTDSLFPFIAFPIGAFLILFITYICLFAWYVKWYIKKYYYSADGDFITIKKGVFAPREIHVQYKKIQDVYVDQDILDRIMGIYDVHIASATIASGMEAHIDGVDESTAEGLKNFLLNAIKSGSHISGGAPKQESKVGENKPQSVNFSEEISSDKYPLTGKWIASRIIPTFLRSLGVVAFFAIFVVKDFGFDAFFANPFASLSTILFVFLLLIIPLLQSIISLMLWKSKYKFNFTPEFIFYRTGVLSIQEKHIPYNTIQDVNVNQGIFDRIFGIAKIKIENASGGQFAIDPVGGRFKMGGGGVSIESLSPADANKITDILKKIVLTKNPEATGL